MPSRAMTRRELFRKSGCLLAAPTLLRGKAAAAPAAQRPSLDPAGLRQYID